MEALFPMVRQQLLSTLLLDPERAWYLSDLAKHNHLTPSSLQRELASLVGVGILTSYHDGNRTYFKADAECPIFRELQGLFLKTSGLADQVRQALQPFQARISVAFIYGSIASNTERSSSDIDVLIVGSVKLAALSKALRPVEDRLSRPINPSLYSEKEFRDKIRSGHHFLSEITKGPKIFIIGTERELAAVTTEGASQVAPDKQAGTRRPASRR
jgi:predicted nucleotidyltransferase